MEKKTYLITLQGVQLEEQENIIRQLSGLGRVADEHWSFIFPTLRVISFQPDDDDIRIDSFKSIICERLNPFESKVLIAKVDMHNYRVFGAPVSSLLSLSQIDYSKGEIKRNFQRFDSRKEAKRIYEMESPQWVYPNGVTSIVPIPFEVWCWLPIIPTGIYEASKFQEYLSE